MGTTHSYPTPYTYRLGNLNQPHKINLIGKVKINYRNIYRNLNFDRNLICVYPQVYVYVGSKVTW